MKRAIWVGLCLTTLVVSFLYFRSNESDAKAYPLVNTASMSRALHFIEKNYVDPAALVSEKMLKKGLSELEKGVAPFRASFRKNRLVTLMGDDEFVLTFRKELSLEDLPVIFSQVLGFVNSQYTGKLTEEERFHLGMHGVISALDAHSLFLSPKAFNEFKIGTKGNFGGLGIVIGIRENALTVIAPIENTPADRAGLKAKDQILRIDSESTINMSLTEAVDRLRGKVGTEVTISLTREGLPKPIDVTLTRALIHIKSVAGRLLDDKKTGLIRIRSFQEDTFDDFRKVFRSFKKQEGSRFSQLILDMRNNPGGLLDQAVAISDFFLKNGVIVKTVATDNQTIEVESASAGDEGEEIPMVVLVNEGSASASEIVSGALQLNNRALVLGNRTFGKGSVQTIYDLRDESAIKLTIAKYLTADDYEVQSVGITPNIALVPVKISKDLVDIYENKSQREADLIEKEKGFSISDQAPSVPDSRHKIRYFEKTLDETQKEEASAKISLDEDFPVHFAEDFLNEFGIDRESFYQNKENTDRWLDTIQQRQNEKLIQAFREVEIDWNSHTPSEKSKLIASVGLFKKEGAPQTEFLSGDEGFIEMIVTNEGKGPSSRVIGVLESEDSLFDGLEFPFGFVKPGETKKWKQTFKVPDFSYKRDKPIQLVFHGEGELPKPKTFHIPVQEPPLPVFSYKYEVLDGQARESSGNKNGVPEVGENIGLKITLKNTGQGVSHSTEIKLKNEGGEEVFITRGNETVKDIKPGDEVSALLLFRVSNQKKILQSVEKIKLSLLVFDTKLGESLTDEIHFPLANKTLSVEPVPGIFQVPPSLELSSNHLRQTGAFYTLEGKTADDEQIRHLFVFLNDEKVFYQKGPSLGKSMAFKTKLKLKEGENTIVVVSQDNRELTSRRQWILWRER